MSGDPKKHQRCHSEAPSEKVRPEPPIETYPPAGGAAAAAVTTSRQPPSDGSSSSSGPNEIGDQDADRGREENLEDNLEPEIVLRLGPIKSRRLEFEYVALYKGFISPIDLIDALRKSLVHTLTEEQLDAFFIRNPELKKFTKATNILTKRVATRHFLKSKLGEEYVHFPLCANLCGNVPNIVDTCGHARCTKCQPEGEGCIICGRVSHVNVSVSLTSRNAKPKCVPPSKWIDMGVDGHLVTNCYLFTDSEAEAKLLYERSPEFFTYTRSKKLLQKINIVEAMIGDDEECTIMLASDIVEQRIGINCILCGSLPRVYLFDCEHLFYCSSCIENNGLRCPGCQSSTDRGAMALKHDLIFLGQ